MAKTGNSLDKDFQDYLERYSRNYNEGKSIPIEEAKEHAIVKLYANYLKEKENIIYEETEHEITQDNGI